MRCQQLNCSLSLLPHLSLSTFFALDTLSLAMATPMEPLPFIKQLAVLISRSLNTLNPNEVLAQKVFGFSQTAPTNTLDSFTKAISSFGKFSPAQAQEIFDLCQQQDTLDAAFQLPGSGLTITDSDVLQPDAPSRPGLSLASGATSDDKHVFRAPAAPRASALGLDRLAMDKRRERAEQDRPSAQVKRIKYDEQDEVTDQEEFKSTPSSCCQPDSCVAADLNPAAIVLSAFATCPQQLALTPRRHAFSSWRIVASCPSTTRRASRKEGQDASRGPC